MSNENEDPKKFDKAEVYAVEYLESDEHIALFEKIKIVHDECQRMNLPCLLLVESPTRKDKPFCLFHIHNKTGLEDYDGMTSQFFKLINNIHSFLSWLTQGQYVVSCINKKDNSDGEDWKNKMITILNFKQDDKIVGTTENIPVPRVGESVDIKNDKYRITGRVFSVEHSIIIGEASLVEIYVL